MAKEMAAPIPWAPGSFGFFLLRAQLLTFFRAPEKKKGSSVFPAGRPHPETPPEPSPCLLSTRKSRSEVPERENYLGKGGVTGEKKEKRMRKKRWDYLSFVEKEPATDPGQSEPEVVPNR